MAVAGESADAPAPDDDQQGGGYAHLPKAKREGAGLCLSGGGFRATLFHLGALRRLNELGLLSTMKKISSVSGGSITNGLLAKWWPKLTKDEKGVFTNFDAFEAEARAFCSHD